MKLKLADWASIAEIVSGLAVVITLIFLVIGIRENTVVARTTAYDRNIDSLNLSRTDILNDPDLARLWQALQDEDLSGVDETGMVRLRLIVNIGFGTYEKSYFANKYGVLGESEWSRFVNQICLQYGHVRLYPALSDGLHAVITEEFREYIGRSCNPTEE